MPRPPAHVAPYVEALGLEAAVAFLLAYGGAPFYLPKAPRPDSAGAEVIGQDGLVGRAAVAPRLQKNRVPVANPWLARVLAWQGHPVAAIARRLRASDTAVRGWLKRGGPR